MGNCIHKSRELHKQRWVMGVGTVELSQADATARAVWVRGSPEPGERVVSSVDMRLLLAALRGCCQP